MNREPLARFVDRLRSLLSGKGPGGRFFYGMVGMALLPLALVSLAGLPATLLPYLAIVLMIVLIAAFLADYLTTPIQRLSVWSRQIAQGDVTNMDRMLSGSEFVEMHASLSSVTQSLHAVIDTCKAVADGNLAKEMTARGKGDSLANAVNLMTANLRRIVKQAENLTDGKTTTEILVRSDADMLGKSLRHMTGKLLRINEEHRKALNSARKLTDYLNNLPAPVFTIDRNMKVTYANPAAAALTVFSQDECVGSNCWTLFRTTLCHSRQCPGERVFNEGRAASGESIVNPDEIELPVSYMATPLFDTSGELEGAVIYFEDISQRILAIEELQRANTGLKEQAKRLLASEEALQARQEELLLANRRLEERTETLEEQQSSVLLQNVELETVRHGLERKTRDLEMASRYKTEFLANMSHELRTPLNSMLLLSKTLASNKEGNLSERQVEFARTIYHAGSDLLELINEILDLSKVEAGKIVLKKSTIEVRALADGLRQMFEELARGKTLNFSVNVDENMPDFIYSDRMRVEQILKNFLSNAFKFTEVGSVCLSFSRYVEAETIGARKLRGEVILMAVTDTGIGIAADLHEHIFGEFQQVDGTRTRKHGGTGLGLSISRKLADLLGGEIILSSEKKWGSCFSFILPLSGNQGMASPAGRGHAAKGASPPGRDDKIQQPVEGAQEKIAVRSFFSGKRVLLVDDDMRTIFALTALFEGWGIEVLFSKNLEDALRIVRSGTSLDLVLVDFAMKNGDGESALWILRQNIADVPVVVMIDEKNRIASAGEQGRVMEVGSYLPKPCDPERLQRLCTYWMSG